MSDRSIEDDKPQFQAVGICHRCVHRETTFTCAAFPDGIPSLILAGRINHIEPIEGDHGIQYEQKF